MQNERNKTKNWVVEWNQNSDFFHLFSELELLTNKIVKTD